MLHVTRSDAEELLRAHLDKTELGLAHDDSLEGAIVSWISESSGAFHLAQVRKTVPLQPVSPGKCRGLETGGRCSKPGMACCCEVRPGAKPGHVISLRGVVISMVCNML
jgi:hypothetical protein